MNKQKNNKRLLLIAVSCAVLSFNANLVSATNKEKPNLGIERIEQSTHTITGVVSDENGLPLIGVAVVDQSTKNGAITDFDGKFVLKVNSLNTSIQFSYLGYEPITEQLKGRTTLNIKMGEDTQLLDEVVVVGYGTQRKSSITGSISSVNTDRLKDVSSPSVSNMLQGKVAGVVVTPTSGRPGDGATIRVRGLGSISGNQDPLWVIDGVVGSALAELNSNDIESISILKDGSATALYGSRGANGVVLVTTKKGRTGMSQINASVKLGVAQLQRGKARMMNGAEYYDYVEQAYKNSGLELPAEYQPYLKNMNTDWWDIATQNALSQNYNLSYQFGNEKIRSYISGDYYDETGTIKGFDYKRFTLRSNTDYIVNDRLTLKANIAFSYKETFDQEYSIGSYYSYSPWDTPYNSRGQLKSGKEGRPNASNAPTADPRDYWYSDGGHNYLYDRDLNWGKNNTNATDLGLGFNYKIFDFLTFESNNRVGFSNYFSETYTDPESLSGEATDGKIYNYNYNQRYIYTNQMLRMLKTFNDVHEVNAFLGVEYNESKTRNSDGSATNMFPGNEVLSGGAANDKVSGGKSEYKDAAFIFNANYAYDSKYLFQLSYRYDGSSRFGSNKRWASFWSIGGGWNAHKEGFIQDLEFITELKPRISYGISGNQPRGAYDWATVYSTTGQYGSNVSLSTNYAGNPNLSWEETGTFDFGLDVRLFDRLGITFDYYYKNVKNLLYLEHLTAVTGFNRRQANDGKLKNSGFEVTITPEIIKTKDFFWDVSFNIGYNKNKITSLPQGNQYEMKAVAEGYPYLNWYMQEWAGVDPMTGKPLWFITDKETGEKTATGEYNKATRVLLNSSPTPKVNGGINTNFSWKNLSFNASFTFAAGAKIYNSMRSGSLDRDAERISQPPMKLANDWVVWEKPGDIATHPQPLIGGNNAASSTSTRYLERGDYFKLKSISIAYAFPKHILKYLKVSDLSVVLGGENLFTITKYTGQDPEVLLSSEHTGSGGTAYPTTRRFTLGLNLKF